MGLSGFSLRSPGERRRRGRRALSHDQRRIGWHLLGHVDPERVWPANLNIGYVGSPFYGVFGSPNAPVHHMLLYSARILKVPERRSEFAKIRNEIAETRRMISVC